MKIRKTKNPKTATSHTTTVTVDGTTLTVSNNGKKHTWDFKRCKITDKNVILTSRMYNGLQNAVTTISNGRLSNSTMECEVPDLTMVLKHLERNILLDSFGLTEALYTRTHNVYRKEFIVKNTNGYAIVKNGTITLAKEINGRMVSSTAIMRCGAIPYKYGNDNTPISYAELSNYRDIDAMPMTMTDIKLANTLSSGYASIYFPN